MNEKSSSNNIALKTIVSQALEIYALAQLEMLHTQEHLDSVLKMQIKKLDGEKQKELLDAPGQVGVQLHEAGQHRLGELLNMQQLVLKSASELIEKAGLAHATGAAANEDCDSVQTEHSPEQSAAAFREAQTAYADLRLALFKLAESNLQQRQWEGVRFLAQPLLSDPKGALFAKALELFGATYLIPAEDLLQAGKLNEAEQLAQNAAKYANPDAKNLITRISVKRLEQVYALRREQEAQKQKAWEKELSTAGSLLSNGKLDEAEQLVKNALSKLGGNSLAQEILEQVKSERQKQADALRREREAQQKKEREKFLAPARRMIEQMELVKVPAGRFLGGDKKTPYDLKEYFIGKYPVTNAQFILFEDASEHAKIANRTQGFENHPVVNVSMNDAVEFCEWARQISGINLRLPSELEWEKAARGTDGRAYPWGNQSPDASRCNFNNNHGTTTPVGNYSKKGDSPYGCADMAGNVREWCDGQSLRGGAFNDDADAVCCAYSFYSARFDRRNSYLGFRVCMFPKSL